MSAELASTHLDAVLAAGAEQSLQRLQQAAHALRGRTDAVRHAVCMALRRKGGRARVLTPCAPCSQALQSLYSSVAAHYGAADGRDTDADAAVDDALVALPDGTSAAAGRWADAQQLRSLASAHARAADATRAAAAALALDAARSAVAEAARLCGERLQAGRVVQAAAAVAACAPAVAAAPPGDTPAVVTLQAAYQSLCDDVAQALAAQVASRVEGGPGGGTLRLAVQPSGDADAWPALLLAMRGLGDDGRTMGAAAQRLAGVLVTTLVAPLLQAPTPGALLRVRTDALARGGAASVVEVALQPEQPQAPGTSLRALHPLLAWCASTAAPDEVAAPALGATLLPAVLPAISDWATACASAHPGDEALADALAAAHDVQRAWPGGPPAFRAAGAAQDAVAAAVRSAWRAQAQGVRSSVIAQARQAAVGDALGTSGAPLRLGGRWHSDARRQVGAEEVGGDNSSCAQFPPCAVPPGALAVAQLLDGLFADSHAAWHGPACDAALTYAACCAAPQHAASGATPGGAMLHANACSLLASRLLGLALLSTDTSSNVVVGVAAALQAQHRAVLLAAVASASADVEQHLQALCDGGRAFERAGSRGQQLGEALVGGAHMAARFHAICDTLPSSTASACAGQVWHTLGRAVVDAVLRVRDISVEDCTALGTALEALLREAALSAVGEPDEAAAPGWHQLRRLRTLLDAPLRDIGAAAQAGGGIVKGFTAAELAGFIVAAFEDSPLREEVLQRIQDMEE